MAQSEVTEIVVRLPEPLLQEPPKNPFLSLISKFLPKPQEVKTEPEQKTESVYKEELVKSADGEEGYRSNSKPEVVRFPVRKPDVPSLKLENEEAEKDTNPIVLWQVYALGGFIILRWAWAKWQERKAKAKKDSSNEAQPPSDS